MNMNAKQIHEKLSLDGVRLFAFNLGSDRTTYIHSCKTVKEWRDDIRRFIAEIKHAKDSNGNAEDKVFNAMNTKLHAAGYVEVTDIVSDVFEGRIAVYSAGIEDDPSHDEQADGFGHYGWESK